MRALDGTSSVGEVMAHVDRLRAIPGAGDALVDLLAEQAPVYAGRSTAEAERLRGYLLASFEATGLPASALSLVIEELESGLNPCTVAAAAKGLRGASTVPERIVPLLLDAIERIRQSDDVVRFDAGAAAVRGGAPPTALTELLRTLAWLGPRARPALPALEAMLARDPPVVSAAVLAEIKATLAAVARGQPPAVHACCVGHAAIAPAVPTAETNIADTELQDQDGAILSFGQFVGGRPSVLTFFYTRCMNPNKCSLTITKLARLQQLVGAAGLSGQVNVAAISYDPAFDLPRRLRAYGAERGMGFDARNRLLRTTGPFEPLRRSFDLGVGYGSTTVNAHRVELLVLDDHMRPSTSFARVQWQESEVLAALQSLLVASPAVIARGIAGSASPDM
jgi:cytochrome oxidase Cu insertion factor (SCO1/SenC/PrrC family)